MKSKGRIDSATTAVRCLKALQKSHVFDPEDLMFKQDVSDSLAILSKLATKSQQMKGQ